MKKYINNRVYDTDTAKSIAEWYTKGFSTDDYKYCEEELYMKKNGEYFLYGKGGAMTSYGELVGHSMTSGRKIIPFTLEMAMKWAEEKLDADEYEKIFGITEDDTLTKVGLSISKNALEKAKRKSQEKGINSISKYIESLILADNE